MIYSGNEKGDVVQPTLAFRVCDPVSDQDMAAFELMKPELLENIVIRGYLSCMSGLPGKECLLPYLGRMTPDTLVDTLLSVAPDALPPVGQRHTVF